MNVPEQKRIEDFIKSLGRDDLIYLNSLIIERLKLLSQMTSSEAMSRFNLGERVKFTGNDGKILKGTIVRLNKKTVSIKTDNGHHWNVAPQLLKEAGNG